MKHHAAPTARASRARHRGEGRGFIAEPSEHGKLVDDWAEALGESFLTAALSGEPLADGMLDAFVTEEVGGPFVQDDAAGEPNLVPPPRVPRKA